MKLYFPLFLLFKIQQTDKTGSTYSEQKITNINYTIIVVGDLNAAINILKRYEQNHIALLTAPLDVTSVVNRYNLLTNTCS